MVGGGWWGVQKIILFFFVVCETPRLTQSAKGPPSRRRSLFIQKRKGQKKERKQHSPPNRFGRHFLYGNTDRSRYPCTQNVFHSIHDARAQFVRVVQRPILEQQDRDLLRDDDDGESDAEIYRRQCRIGRKSKV